MWILAHFTRDGEPATGLSPLVRIRDVETAVVVVTGSLMSEHGDGFYRYDFSLYNPERDYAIICDSVTLSGVERYTYASSGEYNEVLDTIESTVSVVDIRTNLLRKIQTNRLELFDGDTDNWILYDDDETTPLLTFSVSDKNGDLIVQCPNTPSKRSGADGVISGTITPEIYMRKSVYDPDENGCVSCAENVSTGSGCISTACEIRNAVDLSHVRLHSMTNTLDHYAGVDKIFYSDNSGNVQELALGASGTVLTSTGPSSTLVWTVASGIGGAPGVSDHGLLTGLTDQDHPASAIYTSTATFSGVLSVADDDVQKALETIDQHLHHTHIGADSSTICGREPIISGSTFTTVSLPLTMANDQYVLITDVMNEVDDESSIYGHGITNVTPTGFTVDYSGDIDSDNYVLHWSICSGTVTSLCTSYYTRSEIDALLGTNKSGKEPISLNDIETSVSFVSPFTADDYALVVSLENEIDSPASEYGMTITETTVNGFKVHYSGNIDSNNYFLNWYATSSGLHGGNYLEAVIDDESPELGGDLDLGNHSIELNTTPSGLVVSGFTVGWSGEISTMIVDLNDPVGGVTPLYMKSNGHWAQTTAASGSTSFPCTALALEAGTGIKKILWKGIVKKGIWSWTPGNIIYLSTVDGALSNTAPTNTGEIVQAVGVAIASDVIRFDPDLAWTEIQ